MDVCVVWLIECPLCVFCCEQFTSNLQLDLGVPIVASQGCAHGYKQEAISISADLVTEGQGTVVCFILSQISTKNMSA